MQQAALIGSLLYSLWLYAWEAKRRTGVSRAVWTVVIWVVIIGSRPVSTWFSFGGGIESYDSGNPFERFIYFVLIGIGLITLSRRGVRWREVVRANRWLAVFFLYWGLSVLWSGTPFVTFKRLIKDWGNVVMVLVVLTERDPIEASKAVFMRCACLLVPLSVILIKFFGELGRAYHIWSGEMMYTGVTMHKNSLAALVLVCGLFLMWDFRDCWQRKSGSRDWLSLGNCGSLLLMTLWLLLTAHSSTSLGCMAAGLAVYFGLGLRAIRAHAKSFGVYAIMAGVFFWLLDASLGLTRWVVVDLLGRDLTLTSRTEIWPMLLARSDGVFLGSGFNSFWCGDRLEFFYEQLGINQAHNGYLETYLNGGVLGLLLLLIYLFSTGRIIRSEVVAGDGFARIRMVFWVIAFLYNFTEAAFNKMGVIWFALLLVTVRAPRLQTFAATVQTAELPGARFSGSHEDTSPEPVFDQPGTFRPARGPFA